MLSDPEGAKERDHPRRSRGQPKPGPLDLSLCTQPSRVLCTACVCVCVCVCVLGGRRWPHTAALDEAGLNLLRMHRTRTAVPLPLNNYTGNWGALWSTRQPSIWTELPAEAAASPPACHCIQKRSGHPGRRRADQAQPLLPSLPPPISPFQKRGSPHGYQRRKRGRDKSGVNRSTPL